jgi:branched-chain amino acid aminotransferase
LRRRKDLFACGGNDSRNPAVLRGDGAFEAIRLYRGRPFALDEHLERLGRTCHALRLENPARLLREEVDCLLRAAGAVDCCLRIVLTRAGRRILLLEPLPAPRERPLRVCFVTYEPTHVLDGAKSLSYAANMLATRLAIERGFDEALLTNRDGHVLEAPRESFFWVGADGRLRTPPLNEHILASITRQKLLELLEVEQQVCLRRDALSCSEAFLASTGFEVDPIGAIEDHALAAPGPLTRRARAAFDALVREQTDQDAVDPGRRRITTTT